MKFHPIQVESYSGSRADERPHRISVNGCEYLVTRLLAESVEEDRESKERVKRFKVLTEQGLAIELIRRQGGDWYLISMLC